MRVGSDDGIGVVGVGVEDGIVSLEPNDDFAMGALRLVLSIATPIAPEVEPERTSRRALRQVIKLGMIDVDGVIIEHQGMEGGKKQKLEVGLGTGINQRPPTWFYTANIYCHS